MYQIVFCIVLIAVFITLCIYVSVLFSQMYKFIEIMENYAVIDNTKYASIHFLVGDLK